MNVTWCKNSALRRAYAAAAGWAPAPPSPVGADALVVRLRADGSWSLEGQGKATIYSS